MQDKTVSIELLEKKCYEQLDSELIELYDYFWSNYFCKRKDEPDENRKLEITLFQQWNYTLLRNLFMMDYYINRNLNKEMKKGDITSFLECEMDFMQSTLLFSNSIDIIEKIKIIIKNINDKKALKKLKKSRNDNTNNILTIRNHVVHNIRPIVNLDNYYNVPKNLEWFSGKFEKSVNWEKQETKEGLMKTLVWEDFDSTGLEYQKLSDYIGFCKEELLSLFTDIVKEEIEYLGVSSSGNEYKLLETNYGEVKQNNSPISGATEVYSVIN